MRNKNKYLIVGFLLFAIFNVCTVSALPTIGNVTFNPNAPIQKSTVTATIQILDIVSEEPAARLIIKECNGNSGVCDQPKNISMTKTENIYSATFDLSFNGATYFDYWFEIKDNQSWLRIPEGFDFYGQVNYNQDANEDNNQNNDNDEDKTPGFELIALLAGLIIIFIVYNKKR